jgi:hypothetical protein
MARIQMDLRNVLLEIHGALEEAGIAHALIGGLALAAHGAGRATADLDLLADGERAEDVDRILRERGYEALLRNVYVGNYLGPTPERGRVDFLFVRRTRGRAILDRAVPHTILGASIRVVDASDLIGLKVQSLSNDPTRRHQDLADVERLLETAEVDLDRVRDYFRLFDCEKELDDLLSRERRR